MAKLFAMYQQPKDPAAFDSYCRVAMENQGEGSAH